MSLVGSLRTHGAFLQDQRKRFGAPFTEAPSPAPIRSVPKPKAEPSPPTIEAPPREGLPSSHEEFLALLKKQRRAGSMKAALEGSC